MRVGSRTEQSASGIRISPLAGERLGRLISNVVLLLLTLVFAVIFGIPLFWALSSSLKEANQILLVPPQWIPNPVQWRNFIDVGQVVPFFLFIRNSFIVTISGTIGGVLSASLVAYGFAYFRFRGRNVLFVILLATMMLPQEVTLIPTYILFWKLGWLDSYKPLVVPLYFGGGAFSVFLFRQFFSTIPRDFAEASKIDGCGHFRFYWQILMPLSVPVLITDCILYFQSLWNDFLNPLIYLQTTEKLTVSVGLLALQTSLGTEAHTGKSTEQLLMAGAVMAMVPSLVIFFVLQRYFIKGVVLSGIKG
ncbi:MAG: carbohydrate ABC transporter permease [Candidatus Dormibacteraceae bacterium]